MKRAVILVILASLMLTGCSGLSKEQLADYQRMKKAYEDMNYKVDMGRYEEAVLFLVSADVVNKKFVQDNKEKFKDIIDEKVFVRLESEAAIDENSEPDKVLDDFTNTEDEYIEPEEGSKDPNSETYPIYGGHYEIIGYGTKEQSEQSIQDFMRLPDNQIKGASVYKDLITYKIDNKFTGIYMLRVTLANDKIVDFKVFR